MGGPAPVTGGRGAASAPDPMAIARGHVRQLDRARQSGQTAQIPVNLGDGTARTALKMAMGQYIACAPEAAGFTGGRVSLAFRRGADGTVNVTASVYELEGDGDADGLRSRADQLAASLRPNLPNRLTDDHGNVHSPVTSVSMEITFGGGDGQGGQGGVMTCE